LYHLTIVDWLYPKYRAVSLVLLPLSIIRIARTRTFPIFSFNERRRRKNGGLGALVRKAPRLSNPGDVGRRVSIFVSPFFHSPPPLDVYVVRGGVDHAPERCVRGRFILLLILNML
jgi:hypothetical protein